jgi:CHAT domain-containing protein
MRRLLLLILGASMAMAQTPEVQRLIEEALSQNNQQHFDAAVASAQKAIDLSRATSDKKGLARAFVRLSAAYYNWRKLDAALIAAKEGETVSAEAGDTESQIHNLNLAGSSLRDQGKLDEALVFYNRALDIGRSTGDKNREAVTLRVMAIVYRMTGEYSRAIPLAQQSLRIARELKDANLEVNALHVLGVFEFEEKHYDLAVEHFSAALKVPSSEGLLRDQNLDGLAASYCELKQYARCIEVNRQQLELALAAGNQGRVAFGYQHLANAQQLSGALGDAYETMLKALATLRSSDHMTYDEWGFLQLVGESLRSLKRDREAVTYFQEAITIVEQLRQGLVPTEQSRAASVAATKPLFDDMIDTQFGLDPSQSLQTVELSRARAFLSILAESKVDLRQNLSTSDRDRENAIFSRISAIQKDLWRPDVTAAVRKQRNADLESAENDLERLHLEIRRSNPLLAGVQYPKPLGLQQIQQEVLKPDTTLIEYYLGEKRSFVWVVSRGQSSSAILPPAKEIAALAGAFRKSLTAQVSSLTVRQAQSESSRLSARLYEMLLKPVERSLESSQSLIIVPDGVLYYVPFEALQAAGSSRYLLERFPISYAPSATSLAVLDQSSPPAQQKMLLAFGDPVYTRSEATAQRGAERGPDLGALPYTRDEVLGIASLFPKGESAVYLGARANQGAVKAEALDHYRYIHFATHGILDESHPSRSGLALTAGAGDGGVLQVDQITGLRIHADVVTLSACSTGLGELVSGEGMLGLVRSFLYAGASSVAVSLWNVNDDATATLMKEFYRNLSRAVPPREALRRAKISLIHQDNALWRHPHFWAPFVLWLR